jgi:hypothetical protein
MPCYRKKTVLTLSSPFGHAAAEPAEQLLVNTAS